MHYRHTDFDVATDPRTTLVCAADLLGALKTCSRDAIETAGNETLLSKCRLCARRYKQHGWLDAEQSVGVWQGCAHAMRLIDLMAS